MNDSDSTKARVRKELFERLKEARKLIPSVTSDAALLNLILEQALDQIERQKPAPGPLPVIEEIRRRKGLGSADAIRSIVDSRDELRSIISEEIARYQSQSQAAPPPKAEPLRKRKAS